MAEPGGKRAAMDPKEHAHGSGPEARPMEDSRGTRAAAAPRGTHDDEVGAFATDIEGARAVQPPKALKMEGRWERL